MHRRKFLLAASALTATAATLGKSTPAAEARLAGTAGPYGETGVPLQVAPGQQLPLGPLANSRYPDSHIETLDKRFKGSVGTGAVERVATGFRWAEGPAYFSAGRYLLFSDIPNNRIVRLLEDDNHLSVFRSPSLNSNGNAVDRQGRLVTCEHSGRRVTRTELDGTISILADRFDGKRLNAPNDVVVAANASIWFTDPGYGILGNYEGLEAEPEQAKRNVFRVDAQTGRVAVVADDFVRPNGICFSPDEKKLYVVDSGITEGGPAHIRVFDVDINKGTLSRGKVFADGFAPAFTDGVRCDVEGNVWCSVGWGDPKEDGVRCYSPAGELLGKIHLPETCANLAFGGLLHNRLYMCATTSLYACYVNTRGAVLP
jgi:gluconolactonase